MHCSQSCDFGTRFINSAQGKDRTQVFDQMFLVEHNKRETHTCISDQEKKEREQQQSNRHSNQILHAESETLCDLPRAPIAYIPNFSICQPAKLIQCWVSPPQCVNELLITPQPQTKLEQWICHEGGSSHDMITIVPTFTTVSTNHNCRNTNKNCCKTPQLLQLRLQLQPQLGKFFPKQIFSLLILICDGRMIFPSAFSTSTIFFTLLLLFCQAELLQ